MTAPYRFFYRVKVDAVWIAAVWHGGRFVDPQRTGSADSNRIDDTDLFCAIFPEAGGGPG